MGTLTRLVRLCKADIHGVMDQMEDRDLLLRQHLRDMREELDRKESRLAGMLASREDARREREHRARESLEQDLELAIAREKDEIARTLIGKLKPLAHHDDELNRHIQALDTDIARLRTELEEQRLLFELRSINDVRCLGVTGHQYHPINLPQGMSCHFVLHTNPAGNSPQPTSRLRSPGKHASSAAGMADTLPAMRQFPLVPCLDEFWL